MSEPKTESRVIKKYPNRRLYDTVESRYITLADIRRLVMDKVDFLVTRSILLQVIAEQEHAGEPLMSQDFLSQVIRSYGGAMQNVVGSYLEQSLKMLSTQQQQIREHLRTSMGSDAYDAISSLTLSLASLPERVSHIRLPGPLRLGKRPSSRSAMFPSMWKEKTSICAAPWRTSPRRNARWRSRPRWGSPSIS